MNWINHITSLSSPIGLGSFFIDHIFSGKMQLIFIDIVLILTIHALYIYLLTRLFRHFVIGSSIGKGRVGGFLLYLAMILLIISSHIGDIFVLTLALDELKILPDTMASFQYVSGMYTTIGSSYTPGVAWQSLPMLLSFTGLFAFSMSGSCLYSMLGYYLSLSKKEDK